MNKHLISRKESVGFFFSAFNYSGQLYIRPLPRCLC